MERQPVTISLLQAKKRKGEKITMITAYDYPTGVIVDKAGIDIVLVGDSLGMVVLGYDSTVPVTMDEMVHHIKATVRGCKIPLVVGDMPFASYNASVEEAIRNASRLVKEGGCAAVKLEGGQEFAEIVRGIVRSGVPVMGHLGLTPQTATVLGGYKVQGKDAKSAKKIMEDALALQEAGAWAVLLEAVPEELGRIITERLEVPVIGIGAGRYCDGQVLVWHDMMGLFDRFLPKFAKQYARCGEIMTGAVQTFIEEVKSGQFPGPENSFTMKPEEVVKLLQ